MATFGQSVPARTTPPASWKPPTRASMLRQARRVRSRAFGDAPCAARRRSAHRLTNSPATAGRRRVATPGRVLVHEDRKGPGVSPPARMTRRLRMHGHVELDTVDSRVGQRVHLRLDALGIDLTAEAREALVGRVLLEHRTGE